MSEEETQPTSDKEENLQNLREQKEALEAQLQELTPLKVAQTVKEAGFDPDTPEGKALSRLAGVESDADAVKNLAEELGFEAAPEEMQLTKEERAAQEFAKKQSDLQSVSTSDEPQTIDDQIAELQAALAKARTAEEWDEARAIGRRLTALGSQKVFQQTMNMG